MDLTKAVLKPAALHAEAGEYIQTDCTPLWSPGITKSDHSWFVNL